MIKLGGLLLAVYLKHIQEHYYRVQTRTTTIPSDSISDFEYSWRPPNS